MQPDGAGLPTVGAKPDMLGAVPGRDVKPDTAGNVEPGRGISVVKGAIADFPPFLKPFGVAGGTSIARTGCWVFELPAHKVPTSLTAAQRGRSASHYEITPRETMPLPFYQDALASTRAAWTKVLP